MASNWVKMNSVTYKMPPDMPDGTTYIRIYLLAVDAKGMELTEMLSDAMPAIINSCMASEGYVDVKAGEVKYLKGLYRKRYLAIL